MDNKRDIVVAACTFSVLALLAGAGCEESAGVSKPVPGKNTSAAPAASKKVRVGDNIYLEVDGDKRRVLINAEVCLRKGPLEQLLTRKNKKEHEAILAAFIDARKLHEALILAKARPGEPVRFTPVYRPASGTAIKITLEYKVKGVTKKVDARSWVKNTKTGTELPSDWVFAGSMLVDNPFDKDAAKIYLANDGDVVCVSNFESALLDLPVKSAKDDADRAFEAWESRIPPVGTEVTVILEPVLVAKAGKPKK